MAFRVQILRHDPATAATFVGLEGEVTFELVNNRLRLHDNTTPGGFIVPNEAQTAVLIAALESTLTANINAVDSAKMSRAVITGVNDVLIGIAANSEGVLPMGPSTIMARLAAGNVVAATPAEIRTLLDVVASDPFITSIAALGTAAGKLIKTTGIDTAAEIAITADGEAMIAAADPQAQRDLLSVNTSGEIDSAIAAGLVSLIPTGTIMAFFQAAAPAGWTQDATQNDKVFRVVSGVGGGSAGNWTISGVTVDGHVLTNAEVPAHTHTYDRNRSAGGDQGGGTNQNSGSAATGSSGGDGSHGHGLTADGNWRPAYIDVLLAAKDA